MQSRSGSQSADAGWPQTPGVTLSLQFPKARRLLRHADFQQVYKLGKRQFTGNMTVFFLRRSSDTSQRRAGSEMRVGLTVGKVLGNAVVRNRIKRRMREAVRLSKQNWNSPVDVVFNPRKSVTELPMQELMDEVARALKLAVQRARPAPGGTASVQTEVK
jgi:ribonuclease P protein component